MAKADVRAKRASVRAALFDRMNTERRTYVMPRELVSRILDYQLEHVLPSETEAARRLLEFALDANERRKK